jgi:hypothetical protein
MTRLLLAALAACAISVHAFAADTVAGLVETLEHPTLGSAVPVQNVTFEAGHMKITLTQGSAAPVLAGAETIGLFFKGQGKFEYLSTDPTEAAVMTTNTKRATRMAAAKSDKGLVLQDAFEEVFLQVAGRPLPALPTDGTGATLEAAFTEHRDTFSQERAAPSFVFAKQKLESPSVPLVRAQFRGGKETLVYENDPVVRRSERVYSLHKYRDTTIREYQRALWPVTLSEQLLTGKRTEFAEPLFLLTDLTYTLTASEKADAALSVVETITPRGAAQRVFLFDQLDTIYDGNRRARTFNVRSVKDERGNDLSFVRRKDGLLVGLPAATSAPFKIKFEIDGDFLIRPGGDNYWELGTTPWFPQPEIGSQYYTIHSTLKVKKPFVPFAPGDTVSRREEGDYNVVENRIDKPVQFAVALAGKYAYEEQTENGVTVRVATYGGRNSVAMKKLSNLAHNIIKFYEPFLGPFPFKEFNIIEINDFGYGQAPPGTMFITSEAFTPTDADAQIFSQGINHRFAHEIAHQYWGHVVKMGSTEEQWMTESFAEYSSSFAVRVLRGPGFATSLVKTWKANAGDVHESSSVAMANRLADFGDPQKAFIDRTFLVYDKGAYVLSALHKEIGDQQFLTFLRTMQGAFAWKFITTKDMVGVLQRITQRDYTDFFLRNIWGTEMPK